MISNHEKSLLRTLIQNPAFRIVESVGQELIQGIRDQSNLKDTEWETAKSVALEEGQVKGINTLIKEVYRLAQDA